MGQSGDWPGLRGSVWGVKLHLNILHGSNGVSCSGSRFHSNGSVRWVGPDDNEYRYRPTDIRNPADLSFRADQELKEG